MKGENQRQMQLSNILASIIPKQKTNTSLWCGTNFFSEKFRKIWMFLLFLKIVQVNTNRSASSKTWVCVKVFTLFSTWLDMTLINFSRTSRKGLINHWWLRVFAWKWNKLDMIKIDFLLSTKNVLSKYHIICYEAGYSWACRLFRAWPHRHHLQSTKVWGHDKVLTHRHHL